MVLVLLILLSTVATTWGQPPSTNGPTRAPSRDTATPTFGPASASPTAAPVLNQNDTAIPTLIPTVSPVTQTSIAPTRAPQQTSPPTSVPTGTPSVSPSTSPSISARPTQSSEPTLSPSESPRPSSSPTVSPQPSASPSAFPTISFQPSRTPTSAPSLFPSPSPSDVPSQSPSFSQAFNAQANFRITLLVTEREELNTTERENFEELMVNYTYVFASRAIRVTAFCRVQAQSLVDCSSSDFRCTLNGVNASDPDSIDGFLNDVDFFCNYTSRVTNVTGYPSRLSSFTDLQADRVTRDMQALGFPLLSSFGANIRTAATSRPTESPVAAPTVSPRPTTVAPTNFPTTVRPTDSPSLAPTGSGIGRTPSLNPTLAQQPTLSPTISSPDDGGDSNIAIIVGIVVSLGVISMVGLYIFYRHRMKMRSPTYSATHSEEPGQKAESTRSYKATGPGYDSVYAEGRGVVSPNESLVSKQSLLSAGSGVGDESDLEEDGTGKIKDEFDQYKDKNLEVLRSEVEGNMPGFEGVMSAAVTRALMGDDELQQEITPEVTWGCTGTPTGPEIEASVLCEVNDWMKFHEGGSLEQKRLFMQGVLNRMVTSVRLGVVNAEDASRTIHESAALLGLKLANELPMTTVIVSGMRKTAAASHMMSVMRDFGDIDVAAVASRQKGFGIVRFRHPRAVDKVMRKYRIGEIVIQDVAVQIKALMPSGSVEGRNG